MHRSPLARRSTLLPPARPAARSLTALLALLALAAACGDSAGSATAGFDAPGPGDDSHAADTAGTADIPPTDLGGDGGAATTPLPLRAPDGSLALDVVIPPDSGPALALASQDLASALAALVGAPAAAPRTAAAAGRPAIEARVAPDEGPLGDEGYRFEASPDGGAVVVGRTDVGAAYGLWHVAHALGVRWIHPNEPTFVPPNPSATVPTLPNGPQLPRFARRGFHEHTQHPIPMSDYLLRPGSADFRERLSAYARWMARNRQNTLFFHMLKTVDLDAWIPTMADFTAEARGLGVTVGAILSFADQQQNNFKLIREDATDASGAPLPDDVQIRDGLDRVLQAGLGVVGFQFGTSEFTKPTDATALGWLETARAHLASTHPDVPAFAWIHVTCSLKAEGGGQFFHLPAASDPGLGAFVHTTMFYAADAPAPVYDCENFTHQGGFLEDQDGARPLVWFPESAWWLGFDDNVPLALPITGASREHDVLQVLAGHDVEGHITFTTGREWTYWQIDHYLTELTWDGATTWDGYLASLAPLYGSEGPAVTEALTDLTALQTQALTEDNPLLIFYLAGELPQDEIGARAGILARRPKLPFSTVLGYDDDELAAWRASDMDRLVALRDAVAPLVEPLPDTLGDADASDQQRRLYREARATLVLFLRRVEHAIALYEGVVATRAGDRPGAEARLAEARAISAEVLATVQAAEADYRDPIDILARAKPETLTSYPYGYLEETSTAFFWTRRDDQLDTLITDVFDAAAQQWSAPMSPVWRTVDGQTTLLEPQSALAGPILTGFVPRLLLGVAATDATGPTAIAVAQDHDRNDLPEPETEAAFPGTTGPDGFVGTAAEWAVDVRDSAGQSIGTLTVLAPTLTVDAVSTRDALTATRAELGGHITKENLLALVMSVGGIDREGAENLAAGVYGVSPLPEELPMRFGFALEPVPPTN